MKTPRFWLVLAMTCCGSLWAEDSGDPASASDLLQTKLAETEEKLVQARMDAEAKDVRIAELEQALVKEPESSLTDADELQEMVNELRSLNASLRDQNEQLVKELAALKQSAPSTTKSNGATAPDSAKNASPVPTGVPVPGKPGFVSSPFDPEGGFIDLRGVPAGTEVKDPYTGKVFLAP